MVVVLFGKTILRVNTKLGLVLANPLRKQEFVLKVCHLQQDSPVTERAPHLFTHM